MDNTQDKFLKVNIDNYIKRYNQETGQVAQQIGIFKSKSDSFINLK